MSKHTKGVETLLGNPKKAVFKLSLPIILTNFIQTIYNLADAIWVAGIGADALAAVGFFFPFFFVIIALGMGLGIGGGSAISRRIGANDRERAGLVATHTVFLTVVASAIFSLSLFFSIKFILFKLGAGNTLAMSTTYAKIIIAGAFFVVFANVGTAILRSEGDTKRSMWAMMLGAGLNIILDPIFIYGFKLGVAGAAWATIISFAISSILIGYWLFFKKDTYVPMSIRTFIFKTAIIKEIFSVGIPATIQSITMAMSAFILNIIVSNTAGPDGIAVLVTGWRIIMIGTMPVFGIAVAIVSISGAAYGAKDMIKLKDGYKFALKAAVLIELGAAITILIFAPYIAKIFTYSESAAHIADELVLFLRITAISYPAVAIGPISSSLFQGIGLGFRSLVLTVLRTIVLMLPLTIFFVYILKLGVTGVWWGISCSNLTLAIVGFSWVNLHIRKLIKQS